jgi:hypothetical protein
VRALPALHRAVPEALEEVMLRRLIVLGLLAAAAFLIYGNRRQLAFLAGMDSNNVRIEGDWQEVRSGFKEDDVFSFSDQVVFRNGETYGQYRFTSHAVLEVTTASSTSSYLVEFPGADTMEWYQEEGGQRVLQRRWQR